MVTPPNLKINSCLLLNQLQIKPTFSCQWIVHNYNQIIRTMNQVWNAFKAAVRLKLGLANPYRIAAKHCQLTDSTPETEASFMQKQQINRNTYLLRFALGDPDKCLGLMIGQFVKVKVGDKSRPYNPVSRIDEPGLVDLFVRDLRKENTASSFTNRLLNLKEGDKVTLQGPKTQFIYHGYGKLEWEGSPPKVYKHIGILAYESGITGAYTLIDSIMPNYDNHTGLSLLWIGEEPDDFVFLEEFSLLSEQLKLNLNLMLREPRPGWIGPFGKVNKSHIKSYMPPPSDQTALILVCGPEESAHLAPILSELGYKHIMFPLLTA